MSALNVTLAPVPTRGADAAAGKSIDMDSEQGGRSSGFGDVFRELTQPAGDGARPADSADSAAAAARPATSDGTARDTLQTLADALAAAAGRRATRADTAATDVETPAADASSTEAPAKGDAAPADPKAPQAGTTVATTHARRMQDHLGLTSLLFGHGDADATLSPTRLAADKSKTAAGEQPETAASESDRALPASTDTPAPLPQQALDHLPTLPAAMPAAPVPAEPEGNTQGEQAGGGAITGHTPTVAPEPADAQPMRITILSRETHFAPIRTLPMNGASAPTAEAKPAFATAAAAAGVEATASATATATQRTGAAAVQPWAAAAAVLRGKATGASTSGASTSGASASSASTATPAFAVGTAEHEAATTGVVVPQDARGQRSTGRNAEARDDQRATSTTATPAVAARDTATTDVSQARTTDAGAVRTEAEATAPTTGATAASTTITPAPSLPTLRQIGAAIASEVGSLGASAIPRTPTTSLAAGPVRLLDIQLTPDDLGTVNVRMRLSSNGLEIRLRASNADTARMLERDQTALRDLLKASGITADSITIIGGDGAGLTQLTGQDAGRPFTATQQPAGEAGDPRDSDFPDQQGRGSGDEDSQKGQARDDQARSSGRARDAGGSSFRL